MTDELKQKKPPRKARKAKAVPEATADLLAPIRWAALAQGTTADWMSHCQIANGWVMAFDGAVAAGHRVPVDWVANPHTRRLLAALERATAAVGLVVDEGAITVTSGPLRVRVPCLPVLADISFPIDPVVPASDILLAAIKTVAPLVRENATTVLEAAIEIADGCATATDRRALLQVWHGVQTPRLVLPRAAANVLVKRDGLTGVAVSDGKATFWFGDDKWLRFNLYGDETFPNVERIFDMPGNPTPLPQGFSEAVEALLPHVGEDGKMSYDGVLTAGESSYELGPRIEPALVNAASLALVSKCATTADFHVDGKAIFYGDKLRGALAHATP
ncbi:MAG: hypothetical protein ACXW3X_14610 [Rhodoplanes sp.]